jgi:hypothetical protein
LKSLIFDSVNNSSHSCLSGADIFLSDLSITYINFRLSKKPEVNSLAHRLNLMVNLTSYHQ